MLSEAKRISGSGTPVIQLADPLDPKLSFRQSIEWRQSTADIVNR
jgi:hypothetical protein